MAAPHPFTLLPLRLAVGLACLSPLAWPTLPAMAAEVATSTRYDVPAGALSDVLLGISRQSGLIISFDPALTQGLNAGPVNGELAADSAIARALRGSGLSFEHQGPGVVTIQRARVQNAPAETAPSSASTTAAPRSVLGTVVAIGTRRTDQTDLDSVSPVDVVTSDKLEASGYADLQQALQATVPSLHYPRTRANGAVAANRTMSLRGLAPDQTLILVNGKRHYASPVVNTGDGFGRGSQAVDISSIPVSAVERVEVLRDGASAQYGSDAIAGVINVVLKERDSGGRAEATYGQMAQGDGLTHVYTGWKGFALPNDGFVTLALEGSKNDFVNMAYKQDTRSWYSGLGLDAGTQAQLENNAPKDWKSGLGTAENYSALANAELPLTDQWSLYGFANYRHRISGNVGPYRLPNSVNNVRAVHPDGYQPWIWSRTDDALLAFGGKYDDPQWGKLDLSATYGRGKVSLGTRHNLNPSYGEDSPTTFYAGKMINEQTNLAADYSRDLDLAWSANPLTLSSGLGYRRESYRLGAGDDESWSDGGLGSVIGAQSWPGFSREAENYGASREVYSAYAGLEGEVIDSLQVGITGRSEHYSDFGSESTGKLSVRYDFTPQVAVRATASTGYRAPSVGQLGYYTSSYTQFGSERLLTLTVPADTALAQAMGAEDLKPERSRNLSAGIVLRPFDNTWLSFDAYHIKVKDRITLSESLNNNAARAILASQGFDEVYGVSFFTNGLDTTSRGFDIVGRQSIDLQAYGKLDLTLAYNRDETKVDKIQSSILGGDIVGRQVLGLITDATPESTLTLGAKYDYRDWSLWLSTTRYGRYGGYNANDPTQDQFFKPAWVTDAALTYKYRDYDFTVGGQNLFGTTPDLNNSVANGGRMTYSSLAPYNPAGAYYYFKVGVNF